MPAIVAFALCCGERALPICRIGVDDRVFGSFREDLDRSWAIGPELLADGSNVLVGAGGRILGELEDADFGSSHNAVFDAITVLGHAVWCAGESSIDERRTEAKLSAKGMLRLLQGVYSSQHGMFDGWRDHESVRRELESQMRDLRTLLGGTDASAIMIARQRAAMEGQLLVDGVVDRNWSTSLPSEDWPTLF
ncbi:hypothetical protein [Micromonospora sp. NPDC093277]|uniref:hypothetical protein n=1 Tax=Micromonospora sp. NPDC093277 TaxID=3364291 RepID=UPI003829A3AB